MPNVRHFIQNLDYSKLNGDTPIYDVVKESSMLGEVMCELCIDTLSDAAKMMPDEIEFGLVDGELSGNTARKITIDLGEILVKAKVSPLHTNWYYFLR